MLPALVLALRAAQAATLHVGGAAATHDHIEDAVDDAAPGDTIEVAAGAWSERTVTVDKDLTLTGVGGSGAVSWTAGNNAVVLRITNGATVTVTGFSIVARGNAVAVRVEGATATFTDLAIHGNRVNEGNDGSALVAVDATVALADADFDDNRAPGGRGGHVLALRSEISLTGGSFLRGGADRGAGFFLDESTLRASGGTTFAENAAALAGGAIAAVSGSVDLEGATLRANRAVGEEGFPFPTPAGDGGAVFVGEAAALTLADCLLEDNLAEITGGAIAAHGDATVALDATRLVGNRADYGGGLYVADRATVEVDGSYFAENAAESGNGGAIRVRTAGTAGGLSVTGSRFVANTASQAGGAVATTSEGGDSPAVTVSLSEFTDNQAATQGGALSLDDPTRLLVDNTLLCHNRAQDGGGAWVGGAGADHRWTNVIFAENRADDDGGGLLVQPGADAVEVFDAGFFANGAISGGGIYLDGAPAVIGNTIVAYTQAGDGVAGTAPSLAVDYGDFFQNTAQDLPVGVSGTGNLFVDPGLAAYSMDGDCANDDFWIVATSPLVDAGNPAVDDVDGTRSDIGPYGGPEARWPELLDTDGDGAFATVDCDDGDASRFPGNPEVCDGRDQDCDGLRDEEPTDAVPWWADADGDGFGVDGTEVLACEPPDGTAGAGGDCDDGASEVHPGAFEACDGRDTDCDGNGDAGAESETWADADGDGFGDADGEPLTACGPVAGRVDNAEDCDDGNRAVFPGADDEPGDGVDADCDGADGDPPDTVGPGTDPTGDGGAKDSRIQAGGGCGCDAGADGAGGLAGLALATLALRRRRR